MENWRNTAFSSSITGSEITVSQLSYAAALSTDSPGSEGGNPVRVTGESVTGQRAGGIGLIHNLETRAIASLCRSLLSALFPEIALAKGAFFGHEKVAFTGKL